MPRFRQLIYRLIGTLRRGRTERELDEEISTHLSLLEERLLEKGLSPEDARRRARREFGPVARVKEALRPDRMLTGVEQVIADIRFAFASLLRNPGYALTAIVSVALAIGANSAIFSYADGLLLRPLPVPDSDEVVSLRSLSPGASSAVLIGTDRLSWPDFRDFRRQMDSFDGLVAYDDVGAALSPSPETPPRFASGYLVSGDFFQVLGVEPALGRAFGPEEDVVPGRDAVLLLGHAFWTSVFGGDVSIIGRSIKVNGLDFTVVGVAPPSFTGPEQYLPGDFFVPAAMGPAILRARGNAIADELLSARGLRFFRAKGRLKNGVTAAEASREAALVAASLEEAYPATNRGRGAAVHSEVGMRLLSYPMLGLLVTSLFVVVAVNLLVACANVANLLLTRGRTRSREIAMRLSLGAGRARILRLLLSESALIAIAATGLALLFADLAIGIFGTIDVNETVSMTFRMDGRVVVFTAFVAGLSLLLFGLGPAMATTRLDLLRATKVDSSSESGTRSRGRAALATVQIAGSMALLSAAAGFQVLYTEALGSDPGFETAGRITMRLDPSLASFFGPGETQRFYDDLADRVRETPGVRSAALASTVPLSWFNLGITNVVPEGHEFFSESSGVDVFISVVDDRYFETLGIDVLTGRDFEPTDRMDTPTVVVVNEAFAENYLGTEAVGRNLWLPREGGADAEVIGVVPTGRKLSIIEPPIPQIYVALAQTPQTHMTLIAETEGDPAAMAGPLRGLIREHYADVGVFQVQTMDEIFEGGSVEMLRVVGATSKAAGLIGLVLALVGLYALISFQVARRTREVGIRMALGARRADIRAMFLRQAGVVASAGIAIGAGLSVVAGLLLDSGFEGIRFAFDFRLLILGGVAMFATTLAAAAIPARRAAAIDPQVALREE